jgi:hypothetical protein
VSLFMYPPTVARQHLDNDVPVTAKNCCRLVFCALRLISKEYRTGSSTSTVTLPVVGGDENGSLKSEIVKDGHESQGTRTRERLRWQGPRQTCPVLREGASQKQHRNCQRVLNIWS